MCQIYVIVIVIVIARSGKHSYSLRNIDSVMSIHTNLVTCTFGLMSAILHLRLPLRGDILLNFIELLEKIVFTFENSNSFVFTSGNMKLPLTVFKKWIIIAFDIAILSVTVNVNRKPLYLLFCPLSTDSRNESLLIAETRI